MQERKKEEEEGKGLPSETTAGAVRGRDQRKVNTTAPPSPTTTTITFIPAEKRAFFDPDEIKP